jgi:tetratricopeptide (TPR) repeat protein
VAATAPGPAGEAAAEPAPPAAALSEPSRAQETSATGPGSTAPWAPLVQVPSPPEVEAAAEAGASAPEEEAIEITLEEPASLDEVPGAGGPGSTAPWIPVASSDAPAEPPSPSPDTGVGSGPAGPPEASPEPPPAPPPRRQRDRAAELLTLVREHAAAGNRRALASILDEAEAVLGVEALRHHATSLGRAAFEAGRAEAAYRWLSLAREDAPDELTVARDLSRAAEKTGRHAEEVALGALCADAIAHHDPLAASARYRHFSQVLADRLGDLAGAITMLEKALALAPEDRAARRELWGLWSRGGDTRQQALEGWLEAARSDPADADALSAVADLAARLAAEAPPDAAARLRERSRLAASLAAFAAPGRAAPPLRLARTVPPDLRDLLALPGAVGPLGQLLGLLAPFLEPLFPADLARRGATPADRLAAPRAPVVREALEAGVKALGPRPHVCFLVDRPGLEILLENSQPPSLVVPAALEALPGPAVHFLAARALDLLGRGWALSGKFAPRDVGILLELACRFAGGDPPSLGLPAQRTAAFMEALSRSVPHSIAERARPLGAGAAAELAATDVRAVGAAIRQTGSRVALLVTGDPSAALSALLLLERHGPARPTAAQALEQPDLRDLAQLALSDLFLDLRVAVVG